MKDRDSVYMCVRVSMHGSHVCSVHQTLEGAEESVGAANQEAKDKRLDDLFTYRVEVATFYTY